MPEVAAVGAIAIRDGCLLLIRRGRAPSRGRWSLPGGRVEPGESAADAVVREVAEETGLVVEVDALVGEVRRPGADDVIYRISDFSVSVVGGREQAGDDATALAWVPLDQLANRQLSAGLLATLRSWGIV